MQFRIFYIGRVSLLSANITLIGQNAKLAREANGFSQTTIAKFLNVDQSMISKFEKGERSLQSDMLERLANLYGYNVADLSSKTGGPEQRIKTAYRSSWLSANDLEIIHDIKRIGLNLFFMTELLDGDKSEG